MTPVRSTPRWLSRLSSLLLILALLSAFAVPALAQNPVPDTENYDSLGTSATATLPTDWRVDKQVTVRTLETYALAGTVTERLGGNAMSTTAANGIYNYGAGPAASATDRAIGWLSSGSATQSGNLYARFQNGTGGNISSVAVSYGVEKYRNGSNAAGFRIQMYYSTDGATWTTAGANFLSSFPADADNTGFASAPGATVSVSSQTPVFSPAIPSAGEFYLAWNYSVASGTTTSNAQGLAIDNFSIDNPLSVTLATFTAEAQANQIQVTWETLSEANNAGFNLYRADDAAGPQTLLTYVPSQAPGSTQGFAYSYDDLAVQPGQTYWYWLEDVSLSGATTLHGPVSATVSVPTAVTLASLQATPLAPAIPAATAALAGLAGLMAAAGVAVSRRRAR